MLAQTSRPSAAPTAVPTRPTAAADRKKARTMVRGVAPMVRRMAMLPRLTRTSMVKLATTFIAATTTIRVRMMNIITRSTCSAPTKRALRPSQSATLRSSRPSALRSSSATRGAAAGSAMSRSIELTAWSPYSRSSCSIASGTKTSAPSNS